jgi:ABC-type uncharacterized transport system permease subunit
MAAMPRRNIFQRIAGIVLIAGAILAHWYFGRFSPSILDGSSGITALAIMSFGFLIGIWLIAASFVYPKPRR